MPFAVFGLVLEYQFHVASSLSRGQCVRDHFTDLILGSPTGCVPVDIAQASAYLRASQSQPRVVTIQSAPLSNIRSFEPPVGEGRQHSTPGRKEGKLTPESLLDTL